MSEKETNIYSKSLKNLQKAWNTISQDHFKNCKKIWLQETKYKEMSSEDLL